jgi:Kef-type K+ transport system membrane component KefB/Trk K+ transport system NAD-binding subunit
MTLENPFNEVALILALATVLGILGQYLRQPLLIMFLLTGILVGPSVLGIIERYEQIELLAHIGIALLLFIVGLRLDLTLIRTIGPVALATGLGQIFFTSIVGLVLALGLGLPLSDAVYASVALTFSSTIIIVKLLSDKKEIDSLHGQIAVGFLIVQDIAAILALVVLTTLGTSFRQGGSIVSSLFLMSLKGAGFLAFIGVLMRYVLGPLTHRLAGWQEVLLLFSIAWAVLLGALSEWLGFSKEVGAFLAGVSLASTGYRDAVSSRLSVLRDFLLLFFFIELGARMDWSMVGGQFGPSVALSSFVLVGNPLIVMIIMGVMGYRRRTGFLAGLTVAQISEFSLILCSLGLSLGHIRPQTMGLVTLVGVITIFVSTYLIIYSGPLYRVLAKPLKLFERRNPYREAEIDSPSSSRTVDAILIGLGNYGSGLAEYLLRRGWSLLGVDFDPAALDRWRKRQVPVLYGDVADPDIYEHLPLSNARWLVSTIRSKTLNLFLLKHLKTRGERVRVALTASAPDEARLYEQMGARVVLRPFADAAEQAADALTHAMDILPEPLDWPIGFREVRIRSESSVAGKAIRSIPLRSMTGVSILAVSRAGRVYYELNPDFVIYPGDRLVLMGPADELRQAESLLNEIQDRPEDSSVPHFAAAKIQVASDSPLVGKTLAELRFRQQHGVTVVGIERQETRISSPSPAERLCGGDRLIVVGLAEAVERIRAVQAL